MQIPVNKLDVDNGSVSVSRQVIHKPMVIYD